MTQEKVEELIKKLLDLAASPEQHEADLAMERAKELMLKYNIQQSSLASETEQLKVDRQPYVVPFRASSFALKQMPLICTTLCKNFNVFVSITLSTGVIEFWGFPLNIKLARYACDAILNQLQMKWREEYRKARTISFTENYWIGAAQGIYAKFRIKTPTTDIKALTLYNKVEQEFTAHVKGVWSTGGLDKNAAAQAVGNAAGKEAEIYRGITVQNGGKFLK